MAEIVEIDFMYQSLKDSLKDWYKKYYYADVYNIVRNKHIFILNRMYDPERFKNCENIGLERRKFLDEIYMLLEHYYMND
jgi:hypothetical protein